MRVAELAVARRVEMPVGQLRVGGELVGIGKIAVIADLEVASHV